MPKQLQKKRVWELWEWTKQQCCMRKNQNNELKDGKMPSDTDENHRVGWSVSGGAFSRGTSLSHTNVIHGKYINSDNFLYEMHSNSWKALDFELLSPSSLIHNRPYRAAQRRWQPDFMYSLSVLPEKLWDANSLVWVVGGTNWAWVSVCSVHFAPRGNLTD